jgi:biotin transport system substrate-specific component
MAQTQIAVSAPVPRYAAFPPLALHVAAIVGGSLLVAICAHLSVPLPFTPVPLTLQNFAVLLLALTLEPAIAFGALALYLVEGAAGLPVFSPYGPGGMLKLLGPNGGYLMSYPFVAAFASLLVRRIRPVSFASAAFSAAAGSVLIYITGASWLMIVTHQTLGVVFKMAVWPFLPGDALKVCAAAAIAIGVLKLRTKFRSPFTSLDGGSTL